jgi:hypothetical protein
VWDTLDELSAGAAGRLLTAILSANLPDTPTAALASVEALLRDGPADATLHEERNYRLPYDLRTRLDELATALGGGRRPQRSLLIRAIVAAHAPSSAEQARELITTQRIDALRAGLHASTD